MATQTKKPGLAGDLDDLDPVAEAIEERANAGRALEDSGPLAERPIRSNHDRRLHISLGNDLEEQVGIAVAVGQTTCRRQAASALRYGS